MVSMIGMIASALLLISGNDQPDPWDRNVPPLAVNDNKPTGEPSFLHVALAVGSDVDSRPILIVDRLCLNHEAAKIMSDEAIDAEAQIIATQNELEAVQRLVKEKQSEIQVCVFWFKVIATLVLMEILAGSLMEILAGSYAAYKAMK